MEIAGVKLGHAKQLFKAGSDKVHKVASAQPKDLVEAIDLLSNQQARQMIASAKVLLKEKVEALEEEAEELRGAF